MKRIRAARTAERADAKYQILDAQPDREPRAAPLSGARYAVGKAVERPDAILVRSHDMHAMAIPPSVKAIGRAGAGTNNIPVAEMSQRGVPVFNAPGANANAVKELVLAALLLAARNVVPALGYVAGLDAAAPRSRTRRSRTARSSSPASSCRTARSASSASARSAAWSPTPRSSSG